MNPYGFTNYDISSDGERFLMVESDPGAAPTQLNVVLGWLDQLER